jgi:alkanesulfonate monooxygenase SsuD/methylene tetrahydromethanopterin reductase-like flavin-dependent oxidoreductase (luciferase family)
MKVGLFINTQFPEGISLSECVPEMIAQVRAAHEARFASLWFPHHWLTHPLQCCRSPRSWATAQGMRTA